MSETKEQCKVRMDKLAAASREECRRNRSGENKPTTIRALLEYHQAVKELADRVVFVEDDHE